MLALITFLGFFGILAIIPASIASYKGRSFNHWWLYSFFLLGVALVHSLCLTKRSSKQCVYCYKHLVSDKATRCACCGGEQPIV